MGAMDAVVCGRWEATRPAMYALTLVGCEDQSKHSTAMVKYYGMQLLTWCKNVPVSVDPPVLCAQPSRPRGHPSDNKHAAASVECADSAGHIVR